MLFLIIDIILLIYTNIKSSLFLININNFNIVVLIFIIDIIFFNNIYMSIIIFLLYLFNKYILKYGKDFVSFITIYIINYSLFIVLSNLNNFNFYYISSFIVENIFINIVIVSIIYFKFISK